jgi:hypothetical protein
MTEVVRARYLLFVIIVIGVCQGFLWFHVDGDRGASYWDNCKTYEDLLHNNFHIWQAPEVRFLRVAAVLLGCVCGRRFILGLVLCSEFMLIFH